MAKKCPECQHENPDDTLFCGKCGTQFPEQEKIEVTETIEAPKEDLTRGTTFAGRYEIIEELGKGGMGRVYRVEDKKLEQEVALKLIKPEVAKDKKIIERFRNELKTARMIAHKNVCRMFDLGESEGSNFITMEYIRGDDLKSLVRKMDQLSAGQALSIAKQVCDGLIEAHNLGVVHRDLKPQNIMIDTDGNARIMDFGIARSLETKGITGAGVMIGTPEYMAPEQVEGKEVDQRSDIYSLGIILYEMVTGRVPFEGDTPFTIGVKHKSEIPKNPKQLNPEISEDLSCMILKCIEKNPEERYNSVRDLARELHNVMEGILRIGKRASKATASSEKEHDLQSSKHIQKIKRATLKKELAKIIAYSPLSIKNDIIHVTFNRTDRIVKTINEIAKNIRWDTDEIFFFGQGGGVITLILDREKKALFQNILPQAITIREKSAVIRIQEPKAEGFTPGADVPGLYAYYIDQLSKIEISILDIISTGTQLTFVIAEEDLLRAYSALNDSIKDVRKNVEKAKP